MTIPRSSRLMAIVAVAAAGVLCSAAGGTPPSSSPATSTGGGSATTGTGSAPPTTTAGGSSGGMTPLLSARRVPSWIQDSYANAELSKKLSSTFDQIGGATKSSCLVVSRAGMEVSAINPTKPVIPASNMKILTSTVVLQKLGAATRLVTSVRATAKPVDGVVKGNLYLIGGGDPFLFTAAYDRAIVPNEPIYTSVASLAAAIKAAGVTKVTGNLVGDESLFDSVRSVAGWKSDYESDLDVGPLSALELDNGDLQVAPYGPAPDPPEMAASMLKQALSAVGVQVQGNAASGKTPSAAVRLTSVSSPPLSQEIKAMMKISDDTAAELFTKQLGVRFGGAGSTVAGVGVIRRTLATDGLPLGGTIFKDGSGLSRSDRVTCSLISAALARAGTSGDLFDSLPIAGVDGTLYDRMNGTVAQGRLHAKTGSLDNVSSLSGWVLPAKGATGANAQPILFSFIQNGIPSISYGETIGNQIGEDLATPLKLPAQSAAEPRS